MKRKIGIGQIISNIGTIIIGIGLICNGFEIISKPVFRWIVLAGVIVQAAALVYILKNREL